MNRTSFTSLPLHLILIAVFSTISPNVHAVDGANKTVIPWKGGEPAKFGSRQKNVSNSAFYDDVNKSDYNPIDKPIHRLFGDAATEEKFLENEWKKTGGKPAIAQCESGSGLEAFKDAYIKAVSGRGNPLYATDYDLSTENGRDNQKKSPSPVSRSSAAICKSENICCNRGALAGNLRLQEIILNNQFTPPFDATKDKDSQSGICMSEFYGGVTDVDQFCDQTDSLDFNGTSFKSYAMKDGKIDNDKIKSLIARDPNHMTINQEKTMSALCGYGSPTLSPTRFAGCYMAGYLWALNKKYTSNPSCAELLNQRYINGENSNKPSESSGINEAAAADSSAGKTSVVGTPAESKESKAENLTKKP